MEFNVKEIAKWLEQSVKDMQETEWSGCWYKLDNGLGICVYWCDGWGDEPREDVIQDKEHPDYGLVCGIKLIDENDISGGGPYFWKFPYFENGEVATEDTGIMPSEDFEELAKQMLKDFDEVKDLNIDENGLIHETKPEESLKESKECFFEIVFKEKGDEEEKTERYDDDFDGARKDYLFMTQDKKDEYQYVVLRKVCTDYNSEEDIEVIDSFGLNEELKENKNSNIFYVEIDDNQNNAQAIIEIKSAKTKEEACKKAKKLFIKWEDIDSKTYKEYDMEEFVIEPKYIDKKYIVVDENGEEVDNPNKEESLKEDRKLPDSICSNDLYYVVDENNMLCLGPFKTKKRAESYMNATSPWTGRNLYPGCRVIKIGIKNDDIDENGLIHKGEPAPAGEPEAPAEVGQEVEMDESCGKKPLKETFDGEDVISDLIDRAQSMLNDGDYGDMEDCVRQAIDEGLIYTSDVYALLEHYGSIDDSTIIDSFYEDLFSDVLDGLEEPEEEEEDEEEYEDDYEPDEVEYDGDLEDEE